jgi:S-adenosylmethionine:tRNA ribosyltransferase-isomerase
MASTPLLPAVRTEEFRYTLPDALIANHSLEERSASRLLVARATDGTVEHRQFNELASLLPEGSLVVLNDTKVVRARLNARKPTGGGVEVLCLEPVAPTRDPVAALTRRDGAWRTLIGGKNVNSGDRLTLDGMDGASALIVEKNGAEALVEFSLPCTLGEFLSQQGRTPLPPYIKREDTAADVAAYQTVYAEKDGSVAAPTAGLHFTKDILRSLYRSGHLLGRVTLHVGAGTFRPVEAADARAHIMHAERFDVTRDLIISLERQLRSDKPVIAVGTTSARTLETLYWLGVTAILRGLPRDEAGDVALSQWPWGEEWGKPLPLPALALQGLIQWLDARGMINITGRTQLMIAPGYEFKVVRGLVTNFHQPESSLVLLVAAFLGKELWKQAYSEAVEREYRFFSYGDSSLLLRV